MEWHAKPEVQELKREWYGKLAKSGFVDIEQDVDDEGTPGRYLLGMSQGDLRRNLYQSGTDDYFRYARQHLWEMRYGKRRAIWRLHTEAVTFKEIAARVRPRYVVSPKTVGRIVREEAAKMTAKLQTWAEEKYVGGEES